jgi:hypothetical protein
MAKSGKRGPRKGAPAAGSRDAARRTTSTATRRRRKTDRGPQDEGVRLESETVASLEITRSPEDGHTFQGDAVTELANCLWYLKTKYFRKKLLDDSDDETDPRARHALRRIDRSLKALEAASIRLVDPTGTRYPPGGEGMMSPLQFEPTAGISMDTVSETLRPLVFSGNRLIQRGEVFVSVPLREGDRPDEGQSR